MKWNANRNGSVLMEFIVVLPIYMLLLGFVFLVGEVSLHAINLASGDRLLALQRENSTWTEPMGEFEKAASPTKTAKDDSLPDDRALAYRDGTVKTDARASSYDYGERAGLVADTSFRGAWSMVVAATVQDNYTLTPWTRGWVLFWVNRKSRTTEGEFDLDEGSALSDWTKTSGLVRHKMLSKDLSAPSYGYYTLMRKRKDGAGKYRTSRGGFVEWEMVANENWFEEKGAPEDQLIRYIEKAKDRTGSPGSSPTVIGAYSRIGEFKSWTE